MSGKASRRMGPRHLRSRRGKGWREDNATGFIRYAEDYVEDVRQGRTAPEFADITKGFGTHHPQDVKNLGSLDDPKAIPDSRPQDEDLYSKQDMRMSDGEIEASIREGRAPRMGF